MTADFVAGLPTRRGHFLLESGLHADLWLTLDELFTDPVAVAPLIDALAARLRPHAATAVCGPLVGGAFLAQALATSLGARFYYTEPVAAPRDGYDRLFTAEYRLPRTSAKTIRGQTVAVVDDVISAGSSVRATVASIEEAGGSIAVVGALMILGDVALEHFTELGIAAETLERRRFDTWTASECPQCRGGVPLEGRSD